VSSTPRDLLDHARWGPALEVRLQRTRTATFTILQCAFAAGLAWLVAKQVVGHGSPFFAPVAAILTLGLTYGQRGRRALELAIGVALGIGVGDLLVWALGSGWWQIVVVVALAMAAAVFVGGSMLLVNQCAVSAVLVATVQVDNGIDPSRWVDALIGGALALLVNAVVPTDPLRLVRGRAEPVLLELAGALDDTATAIERQDLDAAGRALGRARGIDPLMERYREALSVGQETVSLAPTRRRLRPRLTPYETVVAGLDNAVRNTRVLARGAIRAIELDEHVPELTLDAIRDLARAVRALRGALDDPRHTTEAEAEDAALRAAARSTAALEITANLSASVLVGQVRSTAVDLLRGMGMEGEEARGAVRDARARLGV